MPQRREPRGRIRNTQSDLMCVCVYNFVQQWSQWMMLKSFFLAIPPLGVFLVKWCHQCSMCTPLSQIYPRSHKHTISHGSLHLDHGIISVNTCFCRRFASHQSNKGGEDHPNTDHHPLFRGARWPDFDVVAGIEILQKSLLHFSSTWVTKQITYELEDIQTPCW